ncbi:MAG: hypothetical protein Q9219_000560 [cf. Caloplaca sp. 3 TL-2023]
MPGLSSKATFDLHLETPPHRAHVAGPPRDETEPYEELEITFNKTLEGHYRHGKTGYKRVGALFITWEADDLQCKETEVDALREFFTNEFRYETAFFEIPKDRWQTALQKRIADFFYEYDSPDCLTIIYYGGHGDIGKETKSLKLYARVEPDATGDRSLFMNDILGCCRLPACDQLVIVDCCYAANAFGPHHIGKRKFEMIVSSGCKNRVPAPHHPGSFTKSLSSALKKLLQENNAGFVTSQLYREIYHSISSDVKPWLFDQARRDYGRIWLRPQVKDTSGDTEPEGGAAYLNLTLKLNEKPDSIAMNQLALSLQYLPHIDRVRFEKLYAPRKQIMDFMQFVRQASKLRPLIRKIHKKRRQKQLDAMPRDERILQYSSNFVKLYLDQKNSAACDWSSALNGQNPSPASPAPGHRRKSFTWPPVEGHSSSKEKTLSNKFFSIDYRLSIPGTSLISNFPQLRRAENTLFTSNTNGNFTKNSFYTTYQDDKNSHSGYRRTFDTGYIWDKFKGGDELWHVVMWFALCYTLSCFCFYAKE